MNSDFPVSRCRSRAAYIAAFIGLLQDKTFPEITANEIISGSTYSRASFYRHFRDKYDLAEKMITEEAERYVQMIGTQMLLCSEMSSQEEYVFQVALKTFQHVAENTSLYRIILDSRIDGFDLERFCTLAIDFFKKIGQFVPDKSKSAIDTDFYFYCTTHQFIRYVCYWEKNNFVQTPEYMAAQAAEMINLAKPGAFLSGKRLK